MTSNQIHLTAGDLFSTDADVIVIPKSTQGTVSNAFKDGLQKKYGFRVNEPFAYQSPGEILHHEYTYRTQNGMVRRLQIIFATNVNDNESNLSVIAMLAQRLLAYVKEKKDIKAVAMPLLGTGAGGLVEVDVFRQLIQTFKSDGYKGCDFHIYVPKSIYENLGRSVSQPDFDGEKLLDEDLESKALGALDQFLAICSVYLIDVGENPDESHLNFYESSTWISKTNVEELMNVNSSSVVILKSSYRENGLDMLLIHAIGVVTQRPLDKRRLRVDWVMPTLNYKVRFKNAGEILPLKRVAVDQSHEVFIQLPDWIEVLNHLTNSIRIGKYMLTNVLSKIARIESDADVGTDHLGLAPDIRAFSRIIASNSFKPPLSVALFGKWGSGKSFFMKTLDREIARLAEAGMATVYKKGIAQIHFNAWSYMDANLWASIVSRIFEGLNEYISNDSATNEEKKQIKQTLEKELVITSEELQKIETQKCQSEESLKKLIEDKSKIQEDLKNKIKAIQSETLKSALQAVNEKFNVANQLVPIVAEDTNVRDGVDELKKVIPARYWDNPEVLLVEAKSAQTFLKVFFNKDKILGNLLMIALILLVIWLIPILIRSAIPIVQNYVLPQVQFVLYALTLLLPIWKRSVTVYNKLSPTISAFWKIRENHQQEIVNARYEAAQKEKALELEIQCARQEITKIDQLIHHTTEQIAVLTFKNDHAIATQTLYSFIEKRCNSEEYQKHLGIVSIIRKDFRVLSELFINQDQERKASPDVERFRQLFGKPLERIVLYIDDLDRCPEDRVVEVLEAVNLLMAYPLFVVVVGVDPRWVKRALKTKWNLDQQEVSPADYLEKIFQIPFHLKKADHINVRNMLKALTQPISVDPSIEKFAVGQVTGEIITAPDSVAEFLSENITSNSIGRVIKEDRERQEKIEETDDDEQLELTEKERELILTMAEVIGTNPRAIKRYVNIYQVIRAHEGLLHMIDNEDQEFLVIMFLLAVHTGDFKLLAPVMSQYFDDDGNEQRSLEELMRQPIADSVSIDGLRERLSVVIADRSIYGKLLAEKSSMFKHHNAFIRRFTFADDYQ